MNWLFKQMYDTVSGLWLILPRHIFNDWSDVFVEQIELLGDEGYFFEGRQSFWAEYINTYNFSNLWDDL